MLPVTEVVVLVTSARSPKVLDANRDKAVDCRDVNPGKEAIKVMPWHEDTSKKLLNGYQAESNPPPPPPPPPR